ncbi:HAD family hydrolase [uncultured Clostridium sp.]|uniref:HAD family hydrolase n=1 Tax=uncultured Clostridium sp. TaxID=59620 RepID=UPI0025FB3CC8|nr:HAD family hydrolase [uncultured Clostridium sp.]
MKAVIFDLDDTLYREINFVNGAFRCVCRYLSLQYGISFKKLYKDTIDIFYRYGRGRVFNLLCKEYKVNENVNKLVKIYRNSLPYIELYEDALTFFRDYRYKYKFGIITDGKASVQWNKIKLLNLEKYMDGIIVTDDYGRKYWKPSSFAYLKLLRKFKCKAQNSVYVGDNPYKDFIGARDIGMNTVRVIRQSGEYIDTFLDSCHEADCNINSLNKLEYVIQNRM